MSTIDARRLTESTGRVTRLGTAGDCLYGQSRPHHAPASKRQWFICDTRTGVLAVYDCKDSWRHDLASRGVAQPELRPH